MIITKREPIPYPLFDSMRKHLNLRVFSSYSDPNDQFGTGTASMYTEFGLPNGNLPIVTAKSSWAHDPEADLQTGEVTSEFFLLTQYEMYESDEKYDNISTEGC